MKINFLIPTTGITGGIKVIFEYANRLVDWGHEINIIYPYVLNKNASGKEKIFGKLKRIRHSFYKLFISDIIKWFKLDIRVKIIRVPNLSAKYIPNADATIATANQTADWLVEYPKDKGDKFYFIQDYETWTRPKEQVDATWKMPLKKIVIAKWLEKLAKEKFNEKIYGIVPDGVDFKNFYNNKKIFNKKRRIFMMYHIFEKKGFEDGLRAFKIAKDKHPEISLVLYGAYKLRNWTLKDVDYYYKPTEGKLRELFSESDIFLWPSRVEGFGIPPMEAMACKCAVITTDTGAIREYAISGKTAIIVPPKRSDLMAVELIQLIEDDDKLSGISLGGYDYIRNFGWEKSSKILENILLKKINYK